MKESRAEKKYLKYEAVRQKVTIRTCAYWYYITNQKTGGKSLKRGSARFYYPFTQEQMFDILSERYAGEREIVGVDMSSVKDAARVYTMPLYMYMKRATPYGCECHNKNVGSDKQ